MADAIECGLAMRALCVFCQQAVWLRAMADADLGRALIASSLMTEIPKLKEEVMMRSVGRAQSLEEQELHDYQKDERLRQQRQESADEAALRHIEIEEEIQRLDMEVPFTMWDWSSDDN